MNNTLHHKNAPVFLGSLVLLFFACSMIFQISETGLRITPDSISYYIASLSLVAGNGLRQGMDPQSAFFTHYPPLLPIVLAILHPIVSDIRSFLLIDSSALILTLLILFLLCAKIFRSASLGFFLASCYLVHPSTFQIYRGALSEPLYILFSWATLLLLIQKKSLLTGISSASALLTRYAGVHFLLFYLLLPFLRKENGDRHSFRSVGLLIACPGITLALLAWRNFLVASVLTDRHFVERSVNIFVLFSEIARTILENWIPYGGQALPISVGLILLFLPLLGFLKEKTALLSLCYLTSLAITIGSRIVLDAEIPMNERILFFPFSIALVLAIGLPCSFMIARWKRGMPVLFLFGGMFFLIFQILTPLSLPRVSAFESAGWNGIKGIQVLKELRVEETQIFTNAKDFVLLYADIYAESIPAKIDAGTRVDILGSLVKFQDTLPEDKKVYFAFFPMVHWRWYLWSEEELVQYFSLQLMSEDSRCRIYQLPPATG